MMAATLIHLPNVLGVRRKLYDRVLRRDPCFACGIQPAGTVDHIRARGSGGDNLVSNLTGACDADNNAKGETSLLLWLLARRDESERIAA